MLLSEAKEILENRGYSLSEELDPYQSYLKSVEKEETKKAIYDLEMLCHFKNTKVVGSKIVSTGEIFGVEVTVTFKNYKDILTFIDKYND